MIVLDNLTIKKEEEYFKVSIDIDPEGYSDLTAYSYLELDELLLLNKWITKELKNK